MRAHHQRGRVVQAPQRSRQLITFYILLIVIAVIGIAVLGTRALRLRQEALPPGALLKRTPLTAPTGQTPEGYYFKGSADAPVTVIEYVDFQCPFCARFATTQGLVIDRDYVETGKIKYIVHDYPLKQHPNAIPASEAARCAGDQNAFWPMHDMLFANQAQWSEVNNPLLQFAAYAEQLKLDRDSFLKCMRSGKYTKAITKAVMEGDEAKILATPQFVIDGKQYDAGEIEAAIEAALAASK